MEIFSNATMFADFLAASLRLTIPVAFAALGGVLSERSGVLNIGLEGMMLAGAFGAAVGTYYTGSPYLGLLMGLGAGALAGALLSLLTVTMRVNQLVAGIAVNLLCAGLTSFLARQVFGKEMGRAFVAGLDRLSIPWLSDLPFVGSLLFGQDLLFYLLLVLVALSPYLLFRTAWGLNIRGTGENPRAADTAGVPVFLLRYAAVVGSGALAALGGAHLALSQVHLFSENMSAGKGFIALAAVILGRWNPVLAVLAALLFGVFDAAQLRLQFANPSVPYQVFVILPYVASIAALVMFAKVARQPEALGIAYDREHR